MTVRYNPFFGSFSGSSMGSGASKPNKPARKRSFIDSLSTFGLEDIDEQGKRTAWYDTLMELGSSLVAMGTSKDYTEMSQHIAHAIPRGMSAYRESLGREQKRKQDADDRSDEKELRKLQKRGAEIDLARGEISLNREEELEEIRERQRAYVTDALPKTRQLIVDRITAATENPDPRYRLPKSVAKSYIDKLDELGERYSSTLDPNVADEALDYIDAIGKQMNDKDLAPMVFNEQLRHSIAAQGWVNTGPDGSIIDADVEGFLADKNKDQRWQETYRNLQMQVMTRQADREKRNPLMPTPEQVTNNKEQRMGWLGMVGPMFNREIPSMTSDDLNNAATRQALGMLGIPVKEGPIDKQYVENYLEMMADPDHFAYKDVLETNRKIREMFGENNPEEINFDQTQVNILLKQAEGDKSMVIDTLILYGMREEDIKKKFPFLFPIITGSSSKAK